MPEPGARPTAAQVDPGDHRRPASWAYAWWWVVGALVGIGIEALLTVGVISLVVAGVLGVVGLRTRSLRNSSAVGVVAGIGASVLYLAWLNRGGPGEICRTSGTTTSCVDAWNPWPFLAAGVLLVAVSVLIAWWRTRR